MSYTSDRYGDGEACKYTFSEGQGFRMRQQIGAYRKDLVCTSNLMSKITCPFDAIIDAEFTADITQICIGESVNFEATQHQTSTATYTWDFGDGNIISGTGIGFVTVSHNYTLTSITEAYTVSLTISDADLTAWPNSSTEIKSELTYVSLCPTIASSEGQWYFNNACALDFSSGKPVANNSAYDTDLNQPTIYSPSYYPSLSPSDANGQLVFYASGMTVWNSQHHEVETFSGSGRVLLSVLKPKSNPLDLDDDI